MKYFIIAGEQSGDLHGSNLVRGLRSVDNDAVINCWGGDQMEAAGAHLLVHYSKLAFMGFVTILRNLGEIRKNLDLCKQQIIDFNPDVVIFIDYPGFNLRIAEFASKSGFRTFYYISPKLWAWNEGRVKKVKKYIDRMFIIFPFEVEFYKKHGIEVVYYGNPLVDETEKRKAAFNSRSGILRSLGIDDKPVIALLAGSRKHEIEKVLPQMTRIIRFFPGYRFILAGVRNIPDDFYRKFFGDNDVMLVKDRTYEILHIAEAALVTSGTATLEAALMGTPQVVCYKAALPEMLIAWLIVRVKFISLVNLVMNREIVRELIQYDLNEKNLLEELKAILPGGDRRERILEGYDALDEKLGPSGTSMRIACEMADELRGVINRVKK